MCDIIICGVVCAWLFTPVAVAIACERINSGRADA